jgi:hypothetical protein
MPALDQFDTGYRSPDWDEREPSARRLDYHDMAIVLGVGEMRDQLWRTVRSMRRRDGPEHVRDHIRNALALLLRDVCGDCRMSSQQMRAFIYGLAAQAHREDCIRIFHSHNAK